MSAPVSKGFLKKQRMKVETAKAEKGPSRSAFGALTASGGETDEDDEMQQAEADPYFVKAEIQDEAEGMEVDPAADQPGDSTADSEEVNVECPLLTASLKKEEEKGVAALESELGIEPGTILSPSAAHSDDPDDPEDLFAQFDRPAPSVSQAELRFARMVKAKEELAKAAAGPEPVPGTADDVQPVADAASSTTPPDAGGPATPTQMQGGSTPEIAGARGGPSTPEVTTMKDAPVTPEVAAKAQQSPSDAATPDLFARVKASEEDSPDASPVGPAMAAKADDATDEASPSAGPRPVLGTAAEAESQEPSPQAPPARAASSQDQRGTAADWSRRAARDAEARSQSPGPRPSDEPAASPAAGVQPQPEAPGAAFGPPRTLGRAQLRAMLALEIERSRGGREHGQLATMSPQEFLEHRVQQYTAQASAAEQADIDRAAARSSAVLRNIVNYSEAQADLIAQIQRLIIVGMSHDSGLPFIQDNLDIQMMRVFGANFRDGGAPVFDPPAIAAQRLEAMEEVYLQRHNARMTVRSDVWALAQQDLDDIRDAWGHDGLVGRDTEALVAFLRRRRIQAGINVGIPPMYAHDADHWEAARRAALAPTPAAGPGRVPGTATPAESNVTADGEHESDDDAMNDVNLQQALQAAVTAAAAADEPAAATADEPEQEEAAQSSQQPMTKKARQDEPSTPPSSLEQLILDTDDAGPARVAGTAQMAVDVAEEEPAKGESGDLPPNFFDKALTSLAVFDPDRHGDYDQWCRRNVLKYYDNGVDPEEITEVPHPDDWLRLQRGDGRAFWWNSRTFQSTRMDDAKPTFNPWMIVYNRAASLSFFWNTTNDTTIWLHDAPYGEISVPELSRASKIVLQADIGKPKALAPAFKQPPTKVLMKDWDDKLVRAKREGGPPQGVARDAV